ncbi:MAG: hypothetical protein U0U09_07355 [Cyclobacteriaceae bacterium]
MEHTDQLRKQLTRTRILALTLTVLCGLFLIYAYVQKLEADRNRLEAWQMEQQAAEIREEAERQQAIAVENEKRARQMEILAKQNEIEAKKALEECQKKTH